MNDSTVTKADLVEEVVRVTELPRKESEAVVETIFGSIIGALQGGDRIEIRGFGSFRTRQRRGRTARLRNPGPCRDSQSRMESRPAKPVRLFGRLASSSRDLRVRQCIQDSVGDVS